MRRRRLDQRGLSVIELMISLSLLAIIAPITASIMVSTLQAGRATEEQSRVIDELRLQMYAMSRELRSASCVQLPAVNTPGNTLRFVTEAQTGSSSGTLYVQYQVVTDATDATKRNLVRTQYTDDSFTTLTGTRIVGPGLVSPNTTFELRETPRKRIIIILQLQLSSTRPVQQLTTTIAGRNTWIVC